MFGIFEYWFVRMEKEMQIFGMQVTSNLSRLYHRELQEHTAVCGAMLHLQSHGSLVHRQFHQTDT